MKIALLVIEFISSVALIILILLHSPKGEGLGGIGGQARIFSAQKGLESGLDKLTAIMGTIFLLSAALLSIYF